MHVYLPIAGLSANVATLLVMGGAVGYLSGLFGVGGGFLLTPLLMITGIPPAVAVATGSAHIVASSVSGALAQGKRGLIDVRLAAVLTAGGAFGAIIGVSLVRALRTSGQFELFVSLAYILLLGAVGLLMLIESIDAIYRARQGATPSARRSGQHGWMQELPFRLRFPRSKLYISVVPPLLIGAFVGMLTAVMGVGGGFLLVPAMIYLLRVPTNVAIATSLLQIVFVSAATTVLHAAMNRTVDVVLALFLMIGGVIGAQLGARAGATIKAEQLRFLLAALVLLVCVRVGYDLVAVPAELYSTHGLSTGL